MGSAGRRSAAYVAYRKHIQQTRPPCAIHSGPWCTGAGTTVDHDPPLSSFPHPNQWRGQLQAACKPCQDVQGARIRNGHIYTTWQW